MSWQTVALGLILPFEQYRSHPYQDEGGVWTIGYGTTNLNGKPVTATTAPVSEPDAQAAVLAYLMPTHGAFLVHAAREGSDSQVGAMMSLAYNIGKAAFLTSHVFEQFNAGNFKAAAADFENWDHVDGVSSSGLLRRRQAEAAVFLKL